jgi:hypothetical protein
MQHAPGSVMDPEKAMRSGYLYLETRDDHPGMVRVRMSTELPSTQQGEAGAKIRAISSYQDLDAAAMHVHEHLKRHLVDIDRHLYKVSLAEALAALSTLSLTCRIVWTDPAIDEETLEAKDSFIEQHRSARRHRDIWIRIIIWIAVALLAFNLLSGLFGSRLGIWF